MIHDPQEPHQRIGRYAKNDNDEAFFAALNHALVNVALPSGEAASVASERLPIIYIVGAPRSGTTLLSQVLSRYLPVGYIDNLVARFWERPSVGIRLSQSLLGDAKRESIAFDSQHGVTNGIAGPHEFGYFWRKWLALDASATHKLSNDEAALIDHAALRQVLLDEILGQFGTPVVFKNVICGFQAEILTHLHPASLFVWIRRNPEDVVRSILKCRMERYGRYDAWWSLKPATYPEIATLTSPAEQVMRQVADCTREFERELAKPGVHTQQVDYAELVNNPGAVLKKVCAAVQRLGYDISPLSADLPAFRSPGKIRLADSLEAELEAAFGMTDSL